MTRHLFGALACLLVCLPAFSKAEHVSQIALASQDAELDHIIITDEDQTSDKSITEVDLDLHTGFAKEINRLDFEVRYTNTGELLNRVPGIQVKQSSGSGSTNSISIRGSNGKQVNIFLDGMLINNPATGFSQSQLIPTVLIESIEAYPDFTPVQLGNANLAGAINFKTRKLSQTDSGGQVSLAYGSFETKQIEASIWGSVNGWSSIIGINHRESDNDFTIEKDAFESGYRNRKNDGYVSDHLFVKTGKQLKNSSISFLAQYSDSEKEVPTILNLLRDDATLATKNWRLQSTFDYNLYSASAGHRLYLSQQKTIFKDPNDTVGLDADHTESMLNSYGIFNVVSFPLKGSVITFGLDLIKDQIDQDDKIDHVNLSKGSRNTIVASFANHWNASKHTLINVTGRYYKVNDSIEFNQRLEQPSSETSEHSIQAGLKWDATKSLSIKANAGKLIRIPTLFEKFGREGLFEGQPDLEHEKADVIDTGFSFLLEPISWHTSLFFKEIKDGIITIYDSRGVGRPTNIAKSQITGIESTLDWKPISWFTGTVHTTILDTKNLSEIKSSKDKKLPGIYHQTYGSDIKFMASDFDIKVSYQLQKELYYDPAHTTEADKKEDVSISFTYFWDQVTFDLTARNLLDKNAKDFNRMPTAGRSYTATLTIDI